MPTTRSTDVREKFTSKKGGADMRTIILVMLVPLVTQAQSSQSDVPKRTMTDSGQTVKKPALVKPVSAQTPENARNPGSSALDALTTSAENLNVIRDGNVRRLTAGGCAPEVSARVNDLKTRLGIAPENKNAGQETAALALASSWFKPAADEVVPAAVQQKKGDLLESVLPGASKAAKPIDAAAADTAELRAELEHLLASCSGLK